MSIRNDCRIEVFQRPRALDTVWAVKVDFNFGIGDAVIVRPDLIDDNRINPWGKGNYPKHPLLFLGMDGLEDNCRRFLARCGSEGAIDPPVPFFDPTQGLTYLSLTALHEVIRGPWDFKRYRWQHDLLPSW